MECVTLAPPSPGSDYYPFIRHGVPAVFFVPGDGPYEGLSVTTSDSLRSVLWGRYHMPDDAWDERFPFEGLGALRRLRASAVIRTARTPTVRVVRRRRGRGPAGSR